MMTAVAAVLAVALHLPMHAFVVDKVSSLPDIAENFILCLVMKPDWPQNTLLSPFFPFFPLFPFFPFMIL